LLNKRWAARHPHCYCTPILCSARRLRAHDVWHNRAAFHFLTDPDNRAAYMARLAAALAPGSHAMVGTFAIDGPDAIDGPEKCSNLRPSAMTRRGYPWYRAAASGLSGRGGIAIRHHWVRRKIFILGHSSARTKLERDQLPCFPNPDV
jgi:hypothetical protein